MILVNSFFLRKLSLRLKPIYKVCNLHSQTNWQSVVGLEIHAQINSESKLFSNSSTKPCAPPNTQVSYYDASLPGTLPVLNKKCVQAGVKTGLALNCKINKVSNFERKHYFYPDLPSGYQVTQNRNPIASNGYLEYEVFNKYEKIGPYTHRSRIKQIQLEEDSGKTINNVDDNKCYVDLNRAGMGLMEIVFEPDLTNGAEAYGLVKELILILRRIDSSTCLMEEGGLRIDANVSINRPGETWGIRTELKNLNSLKMLARAIDYEIDRQIEVLESGGKVINETRTFNKTSQKTVSLRDKEVVLDYRFMPEPSLPPLRLIDNTDTPNSDMVNIDSFTLPQMPKDERRILSADYQLPKDLVIQIVNEEYFEMFRKIMAAEELSSEVVAVFLVMYYKKYVGHPDLLPVERLAELIRLLHQRRIHSTKIGAALDAIKTSPHQTITELVVANGWEVLTDADIIRNLCQQVVDANPNHIRKFFKSGNPNILHSLKMTVLKKTNQKAEFDQVSEIMMEIIEAANSQNK